jgi:hypothetical protein
MKSKYKKEYFFLEVLKLMIIFGIINSLLLYFIYYFLKI